MERQALQLGSLVCLLSMLLAGCHQQSSYPVVVAERAEAAPVVEKQDAAREPAEKAAPTGAAEPTATAGVPSAAPVLRGPTKDITFDTVKLALAKDQPFDRSLLTPDVLAIDNQPIRIRGYILPSFQQTGIKQFVLVRDNQECCFGPGAALHDCIVVDMQPGRTTQYTVRPVAVEGVFSIREMKGLDGKHLAIYHLDGETVE